MTLPAAQLCVVVPVFDEEDNILPLAAEISQALERQTLAFQIVFVDDASRDRTWSRIEAARALDPRVHGLRHGRNAGQSAALWTGFSHTDSRWIATLDGDRQNDPADLVAMIEKLRDYDFICGKRVSRQDNRVRRLSSRVARWARRSALGVDFADTGCAVRVFDRKALDGVFGFNGLHRFLPVLVHGGGFRTLETPVNHRPRVAGVSKYGVWNRVWRGIADLLAVAWYQRRRFRKQSSITSIPPQP
ncbi:MAG: glycosyltransferase family 2 protein [Verrucomicrobia bacterium]|nr:glycosyltransferase family 2 protein [Verrucomicrobiota bacterium]